MDENKEKQEKREFGNITVKYNTEKGDDFQVYKCPFFKCPEYYHNYRDLQSHKVLSHGELPKFFQKDATQKKGGFSIKKVKRLGFYNTRHTLNTMAAMLKIMMNNPEKEVKKKRKMMS